MRLRERVEFNKLYIDYVYQFVRVGLYYEFTRAHLGQTFEVLLLLCMTEIDE